MSIDAIFPFGTTIGELKLFSIEGDQQIQQTLSKAFRNSVFESYDTRNDITPPHQRPQHSPWTRVHLQLRSWNTKEVVEVKVEFHYTLPAIVSLESSESGVVGVGRYEVYGPFLPLKTVVKNVRLWPPPLNRFDPYRPFPIAVDLGGVRGDLELREIPGRVGAPNVLVAVVVLNIADPSLLGLYSFGLDVEYPTGYDPVQNQFDPAQPSSLVSYQLALPSAGRSLYYTADLICVDQSNRVGAHFLHPLGPIPPTIFHEVVTVQAYSTPVECKNSAPYYRVKMKVNSVQQGYGIWAVDFYGSIVPSSENVRLPPRNNDDVQPISERSNAVPRGTYPCTLCNCPSFLEGNANDMTCARNSCLHGFVEHGGG